MDQTLLATLVLSAVAAIVLVLRILASRRRRRDLRRHFREEYERLLRDRAGSPPDREGRPAGVVHSIEERARRQGSR